MADLPLRTARDRRLGEPLPHQLANLTWASQCARGQVPPLARRHYAVLAIVSNSYPPRKGKFPGITHPSATRQQSASTFCYRSTCMC